MESDHANEIALNGRPFASTLLGMPHLDLTNHVRMGQHMSSAGGYSDILTGYVVPEHLPCMPMYAKNGEVKVAIKRLRAGLLGKQKYIKALKREIIVWSSLVHPNILPFLGFMLENYFPLLISEWMENGTAREYVERNPLCDIILLVSGIADGLKYIHDRGYIHSDLKTDNVLISPSHQPLICDFGISRMLDSARRDFVSTTHDGSPRGTIRFMAVELLIPKQGEQAKHSMETDVWAYGMTIYELASRGLPYADLGHDVQVMFAMHRGELPDLSKLCVDGSANSKLCRVCEGCWATDPKERLTMKEITSILLPLSDNTANHDGYNQSSPNLNDLAVGSADELRFAFLPDSPSPPSFYSGFNFGCVDPRVADILNFLHEESKIHSWNRSFSPSLNTSSLGSNNPGVPVSVTPALDSPVGMYGTLYDHGTPASSNGDNNEYQHQHLQNDAVRSRGSSQPNSFQGSATLGLESARMNGSPIPSQAHSPSRGANTQSQGPQSPPHIYTPYQQKLPVLPPLSTVTHMPFGSWLPGLTGLVNDRWSMTGTENVSNNLPVPGFAPNADASELRRSRSESQGHGRKALSANSTPIYADRSGVDASSFYAPSDFVRISDYYPPPPGVSTGEGGVGSIGTGARQRSVNHGGAIRSLSHKRVPSTSPYPSPHASLRVNVTTHATANASQRSRYTEANFICPVPGCGSTFTRHFNLKGHMRSHNES